MTLSDNETTFVPLEPDFTGAESVDPPQDWSEPANLSAATPSRSAAQQDFSGRMDQDPPQEPQDFSGGTKLDPAQASPPLPQGWKAEQPEQAKWGMTFLATPDAEETILREIYSDPVTLGGHWTAQLQWVADLSADPLEIKYSSVNTKWIAFQMRQDIKSTLPVYPAYRRAFSQIVFGKPDMGDREFYDAVAEKYRADDRAAAAAKQAAEEAARTARQRNSIVSERNLTETDGFFPQFAASPPPPPDEHPGPAKDPTAYGIGGDAWRIPHPDAGNAEFRMKIAEVARLWQEWAAKTNQTEPEPPFYGQRIPPHAPDASSSDLENPWGTYHPGIFERIRGIFDPAYRSNKSIQSRLGYLEPTPATTRLLAEMNYAHAIDTTTDPEALKEAAGRYRNDINTSEHLNARAESDLVEFLRWEADIALFLATLPVEEASIELKEAALELEELLAARRTGAFAKAPLNGKRIAGESEIQTEAAEDATVWNRLRTVGRTPGKASVTGRAVISRLENEGKIMDDPVLGKMFQASDGEWYPLKLGDMSHNMDAVTWWNSVGRTFGAKAPEVRQWMLDPENYTIDLFHINRSAGAALGNSGVTYLPPLK